MASSDRLAERNGHIWRLHVAGLSQRKIAERMGLSQMQISRVIEKVSRALPPIDREAIAREQVERIKELHSEMAELYQQARENPPPRVSASGRITVDPATGQPIPDLSVALDAWDRQVKAMERLAKALGLDSPVKLESRQEVEYVIRTEGEAITEEDLT